MVQNNAINHQTKASPANFRENQSSLNMSIPSYVTIYNDPKAGRSFLCNPCQVHCNSDTQISQHLTSKKHVDKVSGKMNYNENTSDSSQLTPAGLISWTAEQQAGNKDYYYSNKKSNIYCEVCKLNFSHEYVLKTHIAGQKHQRKVNAIELLQSLLGSEAGLEIEPETGNGRCNLCDVTFYSPQHVTRHLTGENHIAAKSGRENGSVATRKNNSGPKSSSTNANSASQSKKAKRPLTTQNLPSCITKTGDRFLCNPCQAHCNSDVQLQQHLASKKHVEKVSGRRKAKIAALMGVQTDAPSARGRGRGRGRGGGRGRGRGRGSSKESYGPSWAETLLSPTTSSFYNPSTSTSIDYAHGSYPETSFSTPGGSFGASSLGSTSASDYRIGGSLAETSSSRPIGGGKLYSGYGGRSDPSPYARPEAGGYGRASAQYDRTESYHRPEYDEFEPYRKPAVADYMPAPYGAAHPGERGMPLSYQPLSQNFITSGTIL